MFRHACARGLEGIVSTRVTSRYKSGSCMRSKVKNPATRAVTAELAVQLCAKPTDEVGAPLNCRPRAAKPSVLGM
jgi:hypothetical protein